MMTSSEAIAVSGLCKSFDGKKVVRDVALDVKKGEIFGFLGPNGSGKTTTIRMLCGLLIPDAGQGHCLGYDIVRESKMIKTQVGYMTQRFSFYPDLSVEENLSFIAKIYAMQDARKRVHAILEDMDLYTRRKQLSRELSGGWKQRMALAACLLHEPQLLLLDEPTAGVDPLARRIFWDKIHAMSERGITTLISTHYMDEAERCHRLAYLSFGDLLVTGSVAEVIAATHLFKWSVHGKPDMETLRMMQHIPHVIQASMVGPAIHLFGHDKTAIEAVLNLRVASLGGSWQAEPVSLEDAFISLVQQSRGSL